MVKMKSLEQSLISLRNGFLKKNLIIFVNNSNKVRSFLCFLQKLGVIYSFCLYMSNKFMIRSKYYLNFELQILYRSSNPQYVSVNILLKNYFKKSGKITIILTDKFGMLTAEQAIFLNVGGLLLCTLIF